MKRYLLLVLFFFSLGTVVRAQEQPDTAAVSEERSIRADYDDLTEKLGREINATDRFKAAMEQFVMDNAARKTTFYSLRIFFDNSQSAREESQAVAEAFTEQFPEIPLYRKYVNPYFKVTVGHFRSKSDALKLMEVLKEFYPMIFLIKESSSTN